MKKFLIVLLLAAAAAYFYLPYHTTEKLELALKTADKAELERLIDFPSVRQSVKEQFKAKMEAKIAAQLPPGQAGSLMSNPGAAAAMGPMIDKMVDAMITPESLTSLIKLDKTVSEERRYDLREKTWVSLTEFTARAHDRSIMRLRFEGSKGWRLVAMEMSEEMAKGGP